MSFAPTKYRTEKITRYENISRPVIPVRATQPVPEIQVGRASIRPVVQVAAHELCKLAGIEAWCTVSPVERNIPNIRKLVNICII